MTYSMKTLPPEAHMLLPGAAFPEQRLDMRLRRLTSFLIAAWQNGAVEMVYEGVDMGGSDTLQVTAHLPSARSYEGMCGDMHLISQHGNDDFDATCQPEYNLFNIRGHF